MSIRSILKALPAAAILAAAAPTVASAQQQGSGQVAFGGLISALNNISAQIGRLNALNDLTVSQVRVVNVQDVLKGNNVQALNNALNRNNTEILNLRNVLSGNKCSVVAVCKSLNDVLNNNKVAVGQLVALDVLSGGDVILFYQP